jgi:hypothetical protein
MLSRRFAVEQMGLFITDHLLKNPGAKCQISFVDGNVALGKITERAPGVFQLIAEMQSGPHGMSLVPLCFCADRIGSLVWVSEVKKVDGNNPGVIIPGAN